MNAAQPDNFPACNVFTLAQEGGLTNDSADPGGITNLGVTIPTLTHWLGRPATADDIRALTPDAVAPLYRALYWNACQCGLLPIGVDLMVYDFAVNAGPGTSARELQACLGVAQDGMVGPDTEGAAAEVSPAILIQALRSAHEARYRSLPGFATFGVGWLARLSRCAAAALAMVAPATD